MIAKLNELEGVLEGLEAFIADLKRERDHALDEADSLRKTLDERELDLLALDEELQAAKDELSESGRRFEALADRIRGLLPLLSDMECDAERSGSDCPS